MATEEATQSWTDGALHVIVAGHKNKDDLVGLDSYLVVRQESIATRLNVGNEEVQVYKGPCHVFGMIGNWRNSSFVEVRDAAVINEVSEPVLKCRVPSGTEVSMFSARFENGLTVKGDDAEMDITIFWSPI